MNSGADLRHLNKLESPLYHESATQLKTQNAPGRQPIASHLLRVMQPDSKAVDIRTTALMARLENFFREAPCEEVRDEVDEGERDGYAGKALSLARGLQNCRSARLSKFQAG